MDTQHAAGTGLGILAGTIKGLLVASSSSLAFITWDIIGDTALLASIGGAVGWSVTELLKYLKYKVTGKSSSDE